MGVFAPAISNLEKKGDHLEIFGPMPFIKYWQEFVLARNFKNNTASFISINSLNKLDSKLRKADCMVLRLGGGRDESSDKGATRFTIVRIVDRSVEDFFLLSKRIYAENEIKPFVAENKVGDLLPFRLFNDLNDLNERTAVELGYSTGLFAEALEVETRGPLAGGNKCFTFDFLIDKQSLIPFTHFNGQVEADGVFRGKRKGRDTIFVLEAKIIKDEKTKILDLAKHKLIYPVAALLKEADDFDIVPVYVCVQRANDRWVYNVAECTFDFAITQNSKPMPILTSLSISKVTRLKLWLP